MGHVWDDYLLAVGARVFADASADDLLAPDLLLEVRARARNVLSVLRTVFSGPIDAELIIAYITTASFFFMELIGTSL